ncbi:MAG TPA: 4-hydroxy-tetrahydrodipicolinate reductase, partial [Lysobacter sp.]
MNEARTPVRLLIHGASGRMGQALLRLAGERDDLVVVAAVSRSQPAQRVVDGVAHFAVAELSGAPEFDAAIDFSLPEGFGAILRLCEERGAALVSGTTGLESEQRDALTTAAARIPLLWAANFSLGVAVLNELVERAAAALPGWDCDIVESHHVH